MATKKTSGGSKRIAASLVALGSAVISLVYTAGYVKTQSAADQLAVAAASQTAVVRPGSTATAPSLSIAPTPSSVPASPTTSPQVARARDSARPTIPQIQAPVPTATSPSGSSAVAATSASTSPYKDGTYTGVGYSRHGGVQATVVVRGGKIVSANVSACSTRYPCSAVNPLPAEVVAQQTYQVDYVSGATDSSMAYQGAVAQALAKASA